MHGLTPIALRRTEGKQCAQEAVLAGSTRSVPMLASEFSQLDSRKPQQFRHH